MAVGHNCKIYSHIRILDIHIRISFLLSGNSTVLWNSFYLVQKKTKPILYISKMNKFQFGLP